MKDQVFFKGSLRNKNHRAYAANLVKSGEPIGVFNRGVCAIWGDGANEQFVTSVQQIKGEARGNRPLGATLTTEQVLPHIDIDKIHQSVHPLLDTHKTLRTRIGSLCF